MISEIKPEVQYLTLEGKVVTLGIARGHKEEKEGDRTGAFSDASWRHLDGPYVGKATRGPRGYNNDHHLDIVLPETDDGLYYVPGKLYLTEGGNHVDILSIDHMTYPIHARCADGVPRYVKGRAAGKECSGDVDKKRSTDFMFPPVKCIVGEVKEEPKVAQLELF